MYGIKPLWWMLCLTYYRWASREINPQNPDVLHVYMRRLHYEQLLGVGVTRPVRRTVPARVALADTCTGPVYDMDSGSGE